jgi:SAM-dependent methyltransferase
MPDEPKDQWIPLWPAAICWSAYPFVRPKALRTMNMDQRFVSQRFPRASGYHPEWIMASVSGGANSLWLSEWLTEALDLRPGMRVLDLGCGRGASSIFLRREFGVQVWATDLWNSVSERFQRVTDAGVEDGVFPIHADARSLPFAAEFFDAIICIDAFPYCGGTDDLYLNYLARFVKRGGLVGIAGAGVVQDIGGAVPEHLRARGGPKTRAGASIRRRGGGATGSKAASWTSKWRTRCRMGGRGGWIGTGQSHQQPGGNPGAGDGPRQVPWLRPPGRSQAPDARLSDPIVSGTWGVYEDTVAQ